MSKPRVITNGIVVTTAIDGDPAVSYIIETTSDCVRIGSNESSGRWQGIIRFLEKESDNRPVSRSFYAGIALRSTSGTYAWNLYPTASPVSVIGTSDSPHTISVNDSHTAIVILIWNERPPQEDITDFSCLDYYVGKKELAVIADGKHGIDAQDIEWAYIRTKTNVAPVIYSDESYVDTNNRVYTDDDHLPRVDGYGRSDIEMNGGRTGYPQCTDDPQGVNDTYKFEWEIKREKGSADSTTGKRNWEAYSGTMTLHNNLSESPLTIDTDNDNDQFGTDSEGKVLTKQVRTANVSVYYGTAVQALTSVPTLALRYDDGTAVDSNVATAGVTEVSGSGGTRYMVTVTVKVTPSSASPVPFATHGGLYVDITAVCARGTKNIRFTLEKVMGGAPGINPLIYQLNPTLRVLPFAYDGDDLVPANGRRVTVNVLETDGNTTREKTSAIDGVTYDWGFDSEPKQNTNAMAVGTYITITAEHAAAHDLVWLKLSAGDRETLPIVKDGKNGVSGKNAIRLSLDNEHEDFLYDGGSLVAPSGGASSQMRLYDGEVEKTSDATFEIFSVSGTTSSSSGAYVSGSVLYVKSITAASASVVVRAYYNEAYYYAEFTANRVSQDKYDIVLTPSSIAYNSATYQTQRVRVSAKGIGIGGTPITASISSMPHSGNLRAFWAYVSNNGSVGSMSRLSGDAVYKDVTASECANYAGIYFELRWYDNESTSDTATSGYRVCDFETVEIAKAEDGAPGSPGAPGDDGVLYKLEITSCSLYVKNTAGALITHRVTGQAWKWEGEVRTAVALSPSTDTYVAVRTSSTAGWVHVTSEYNNGTFTDTNMNGLSYEDERNPTSLLYELYVSGSLVATVVVPFTIEGDNGGAGSMGKICYIAGEYNDEITYTSNDEQTVAVEVDNGGETADVYYLAAGSNVVSGNHIAPTDYGQTVWKKGLSNYNLIRTRYLFADFGHLAAFIMTGDWMISQYGVLVDSSGTETVVDGGGANPIVLYGNNVHSGTIIVRVQFTTSGTASITATASSEVNYDKGYVKNSGGSTLIEVSGTQSDTVNQSVSSGGYIDLSYTKDGSVSGNDDKITFNISGVGYTLSLVSATSGMTYTGSSSSGGVIPSDPYTYFDPTDPMADTLPSSGYKFVPNYAVDGLTGATYQNSAYVRGEIRASKYYMARQNIVMQNRGTEIVEDINEGVQVVIAESYSTNGTKNKLRLPSAANNAGMVVDIYYAIGSVPSLEYSVAPFRITSVSGEIVAVRTFFTRTDYPTLSYGQHVKVYSNGYSWIVLDDMDSYSSNLRAEVASIIQELRTNILKSLGASYVAFPDNIKTESFILPASPSNGMVIFCKGITSDLTISTLSHPIVWANSRDIQTAANSSVNIGDDSVILVFSSGKWIRFDCY